MTTVTTVPSTTSTTSTTRSLPSEFNPSTFPVTARTAKCMQLVPIVDAFNQLDACYAAGGGIQACETKVGYADTYAKYQKCLSGVDVVATTSTVTPVVATVTSDSSTGLSKYFVYILLSVTGIGAICSMIVLILLFRRKT